MGQFSCAELSTSSVVGSSVGQILPSLAPMLENATPAVVNISSSTQTRVLDNPLFNDPFFRRFFNIPEQKREKQSRGSGVIIDARKGYVVTNHHVIEKADKVSVILLDGRQFKADLIGTDTETDVALLKIQADNLTALALADSEHLRVGDFVVAIGNPFGLGQTVTSGIISALGRSGLGIEGYEDFIQTDASINPGNSGGALVDLRGELVGINTAILAPGGGNVGIGFAIPSNMVNKIVQHLVDFGEVRRGTLGIRIQDLTPDLANAFRLEGNKGALIAKVERGTPAEKAGLRSGDLITAVNDKSVNSATDVRNRIGLLRIAERVKITIIRKGRTRHLYATIADTNRIEGGNVSLYFEGAKLKDTPNGIQVSSVTRNSNAWKVGLRQMDLIIGFNRREIKDLEELAQRFSRYTARTIQIRRDDEILSIRLN
ncbi:MAG: serine endoprotease DegQ [Gammaproteobacteria bacterium]|nr:MAG: serine endoprotease DegQ [Gammaproteobacteria bacterium]RKZ41098.1 MAG: serine endoprotease DegQ [Gammaproteobacteria bacterium]RKZ74160.1 MAG: serine endoprotease DegQ [Gammaproteobacteria bacterium]